MGERFLFFSNIKQFDHHVSRHASGEVHVTYGAKSTRSKRYSALGNRMPIKDFRGIEFLGTRAFGLGSLPLLHKEYRVKKCSGIFVVDMRDYSKAVFNMLIAILTKEGLPTLLEQVNKHRKVHTYIYSDCHPMIAIVIFDAKSGSDKAE